jgi:glycosyltransferase involved in cell wall biosynthesis
VADPPTPRFPDLGPAALTWAHLITSLEGGGTENFLYQILAHSPARYKHRVFYLNRDGIVGKKIRPLGIPVERTNPLDFYRFLRQKKPQVLHTCLYWASQTGRLVGRAAKIPLILSSQRSIDVWQKPWHRIIDRWTLPLCQAVVVNSAAAQRVVEERMGSKTARPRIFKVENGIDFDLFKPRDRDQAKRLYNLPTHAVVGGTLMRLHPEKGAEKIPPLAKALLQKHKALYLLIGGRGPLEDTLKRQTAELGDRIRWVGWQDDAVQFLSALDFFWLLSREESFSQALLEASGMGLPWFAPDVGGVRELVEAGACGLLHPFQKLSVAESNVEELLAHLPSYQEKAQKAVDRLKNRHSLRTMVDAFYSIVERWRA